MAKIFIEYNDSSDIVIYASGVSNSKETDVEAYAREKSLLMDILTTHSEKTIIYFSTTSVYDPELSSNIYCQHKLAMEKLVHDYATSYHIFRLSEVVGYTDNNKQIVSYLVDNMKRRKIINIWKNATRHLIDVIDVRKICGEIIEKKLFLNTCVNVSSSKRTGIKELVEIIENILGIKVSYKLVDRGSDYIIDISEIQPIVESLGIDFQDAYLVNMIRKYYAKI